jgi:hypothetical protein
MTQSPPPADRYSSADALPPVEPPSAGFIVQLFVIPAVIVLIVIVVWALFTWLAHMGNDPRSYVAALRRNNESRWQEAVNLANELQKSGNDGLKQDAVLANDLASLLNEEIDGGSFDDKPVTLRVYLCRVLGEFHVADVVPTLIKAARTNRDVREQDVRLAALQGLARLIPNLDRAAMQKNAELVDGLLAASKEESPVVRYHAAYTLGVLGGKQADDQLRLLLNDANADVRMNAAAGLARNGDPAGVDMLVTMLAGDDPELTAGEQDERARVGKRIGIQLNALEATAQLAKAAPSADLAKLTAAVDRLIQSAPQADVRAKAEEVKTVLAARKPA